MDDNPETVTGSCMCGAVRYESTEPPSTIGVCHCRMCQRSSGDEALRDYIARREAELPDHVA
jgi:hypothetical protein